MSQHKGSAVGFLRRKLGLSQNELAQKASINYRHLQNIEGGRVDFKLSTAKELAQALSVPACTLLQEELNPNLCQQEIYCPFSLLEELHVGILIIDVEGLVQYANRNYLESITVFSKEELIGKIKIWELTDTLELRGRLKEFHQYRVAQRPKPVPFVSVHKGPGGLGVPITVNWNYRFDKQNNLIGFISVLTRNDGERAS